MTPEQEALRRQAAEQLRRWRVSVSMDRFQALRKLYEDSGVRIFAFKLRLTETMSDEEYDYCFDVARALGADHVTMELPDDVNLTWGQGDTPLGEILRLMKTDKYQFPAVIELEYPIPEGSNAMAELARCFRFCKEALA